MSQYQKIQNQYGASEVPQTDEYGNPIRQTDEAGYGSKQTGHTTGGLGTGTGVATGHRAQGRHGLHRDDGHSSSSSDDERKGGKTKGMKENIKEKIPGVGHRDDRPQHTGSTTTPGGGGGYNDMSSEGQYRNEHGHEKKGVVDKIKEKVPGVGQRDDRPQHTGSTTTPGGGGGYNDMLSEGQYQNEHGHEKKGVVDKIKEKVPGVGHRDDRPQHTGSTTTPGGVGGYDMSSEGQNQHEHGHEKKGVMDKIKEKLPGGH